MKFNKKIAILIVIFALGFIYLYSNMPLSITEYYDGVIISEDKEIEEPVLIQLYGDGYGNLFGDNVFIGTVIVGDLTYDVRLEGDKEYRGIISKSENGNTKTIGSVTITSSFKDFYATFEELDEKYGTNVYVVGPASNKEEADDILENFRPQE